MKAETQFTIIQNKRGRYTEYTGTVESLIKDFKYTLECGKSWEHEKGNKKINVNPKGIKSLLSNLNNAENNRAGDSYSGVYYSLK